MPFPLLIPLITLGVKCVCAGCVVGGTCYVAKKVYDGYKKSHKLRREKLALKSKTIDQAREENKKAQEETDKLNKKLEEIEERIKKREQQIREITDKLKDPNLTENKRQELEELLASLIAQQDDDKREKNQILDKLKNLREQIKNNTKVISGTVSNLDDNHWIWGLITLENILILAACYAIYKILKDDKK